jgi:hypothetical protein
MNDNQYWGVVRWHDDDIRMAFEERGIDPTERMIELVRNSIKQAVIDMQITAAWGTIQYGLTEFLRKNPKVDRYRGKDKTP